MSTRINGLVSIPRPSPRGPASAEAPDGGQAAESARPEPARVFEQLRTSANVEPPANRQREVVAALRSATEDVAVAQAAQAVLSRGRADLERFGVVAEEAARPGTVPRRAEAEAAAERLRRADRDPDLERARDLLREQSARRAVEDAEREAAALQQSADEAPVERPPVLTLVPRRPDESPVEAAEARRVEAEVNRARVEVERLVRDVRPRPDQTLLPDRTSVSTPGEAAETGAAIVSAVQRTNRLESEVNVLREQSASAARSLTSRLGRGSDRRLATEEAAASSARSAARATIEDPARALASQPFITVEAALRVLA